MPFRIRDYTATSFSDRFLPEAKGDLSDLHKNTGYDQRVAPYVFGSVQLVQGEGSQKKHVRVLPVVADSWGKRISEQVAQQLFNLYLRVQDYWEANQFIQHLIDSGIVKSNLRVPYFDESKKSIETEDGVRVTVSEVSGTRPRQISRGELSSHSWARPLPTKEGAFQLELKIFNPDAARGLYSGLMHLMHFRPMQRSQLIGEPDLQSRHGRGEWAYHNFYDWAATLSADMLSALELIGGPAYKTINGYLRNGHSNDVRTDQVVSLLDQAIQKGFIDKEITAYRATRHTHTSSTYVDPAYTFCTLDSDVAQFWNKQMLNNQGSVESIVIPAGSNAAYLDAEGLFEYRGFQELILPRGIEFNVLMPGGMPVLKLM